MSDGYLVSTEWLAALTDDPAIRIVDMRGHLTWEDRDKGPPWRSARGDFDAAHIPGAIYLDFASDLVDLNDPVPLQVAPFSKLEQVLSDKGIGDQHLVVAYDADRSIFATRLWWIFRLCGHSQIRVLDGGWPKWQREGRPVSSKSSDYGRAKFTINAQRYRRSEIDEVRQSLGSSDVVLIDGRTPEQFLGKPKWVDRGGRIPRAISIPSGSLLNMDGTFKSIADLSDLMAAKSVSRDARVITYCALGLSATAVAFALDMLGFQKVSVFDGGWAQWGSREDLPYEAGDAT